VKKENQIKASQLADYQSSLQNGAMNNRSVLLNEMGILEAIMGRQSHKATTAHYISGRTKNTSQTKCNSLNTVRHNSGLNEVKHGKD